MLRVLSVVVAVAVAAPVAEVAAQDCRRNCRAGEKPDPATGCCKKVRTRTRPRTRRAVGHVWVASPRARERITVDGVRRGKTPALLRVGAGRHAVRVGAASIQVDVKRDAIANAVFATRPRKDHAIGRDGKGKVVVTASKLDILDKIYFEVGRSEIKAATYPVLNEVARVVRDNDLWVEIQGHTDSREKGNPSIKRAEAVALYLIAQGVPSHRLRLSAWGETRPIDSNRTARGQARNRRVEFLVLP